MRIISGRARGLKLTPIPLKDQTIRPTSDRCREALFSILADRVPRAKVLDLYAGTGAFGLEALSRGASSAIFVDNGQLALKVIKKNLFLLSKSASDQDPYSATIIKHDLGKNLNLPIAKIDKKERRFDIIFLDPPYNKGFSERTLYQLDGEDYLHSDGIIIVEERKGVVLSAEFDSFKQNDKRTYGDSVFWFYSKK